MFLCYAIDEATPVQIEQNSGPRIDPPLVLSEAVPCFSLTSRLIFQFWVNSLNDVKISSESPCFVEIDSYAMPLMKFYVGYSR